MPNTDDEDLTGWSVPVTRSKRLKPMRKKKSQPATQPAIVEYEEMPENPRDRIHPEMRSLFSRFQEQQMVEKNAKSLACLERRKEVNMAEKLVGGWEPIELTVDSGAADTVTPPDTMDNIDADLTHADEEGFKVASGEVIPNMGMKSGVIATQEWSDLKGVEFQVAPVHKTLLSVSKMVDRGHRVVFDSKWSYVEDLKTGGKTTLVRKKGLFVLQAWVRPRSKKQVGNDNKGEKVNDEKNTPPFQRQGR